MRAGVLTHESVVRLLSTSFIPLMLDTSASAVIRSQAEGVGYKGAVPFLAILSPSGRVIAGTSPQSLLVDLRAAIADHPEWAPGSSSEDANPLATAYQAFALARWEEAAKLAEEQFAARGEPRAALLAAASHLRALRVPAEQILTDRHFFAASDEASFASNERAASLLEAAFDATKSGAEGGASFDAITVEFARLSLVQGDAAGAREVLEEGIATWPGSTRLGEMYYWLGMSHLAEEDEAQALAVWKRGRCKAPASHWSLRAKLLTIGGRQ